MEPDDFEPFEKRAWNSGFVGGMGKRAWNSGFNSKKNVFVFAVRYD